MIFLKFSLISLYLTLMTVKYYILLQKQLLDLDRQLSIVFAEDLSSVPSTNMVANNHGS